MCRFLVCLVLVTSTLVTPRSAAAADSVDLYDTIDSVQLNQHDCTFSGLCNPTLTLRGIHSGGTTASTTTYSFSQGVAADNIQSALQCQRLAVLVMSKPGKFQFGLVFVSSRIFPSGCRVNVAAP